MRVLIPVLLATLLLGATAQSHAVTPASSPTVAPAPSAYQSLTFQAGTRRWWNSATVYEIWPRSFKDADGDGNGDFDGMTSKLGYLQTLGVNAIWLTPMFEAPSYHGYDFQDFYNVERDYGTMAQFERFVAESHKRGIKVILDLVLNHVSDQHPWFLKSARKEAGYEDYFIWRDQRPEGWGQAWSDQPAPEAVWHWNKTRKAYYYGAFGSSQPDVNLRNPEVVAELDRVTAFWLKKGVDGFRLDAVRYAIEDGPLSQQADTQATLDYWTTFTKRVKATNPEALLVGEAWAPLGTVGRYRNGGEGLDAAFDFDFGEDVIGLLNTDSKRAADFGTLSDAPAARHRDALWQNLQQRAAAAPMGYFSPFLTNHDKNRIMHTLQGDAAKAKIAASLLLTSPGTAYLYYGEEIGMRGSKPDPRIRQPMRWQRSTRAVGESTWEPVAADNRGVSVQAEQDDPHSLLNRYRELIGWRMHIAPLRDGIAGEYASGIPALAAWRLRDAHGSVLVAHNLSAQEQTLPLRAVEHLQYTTLLRHTRGGTRITAAGLILPAYGSAVLLGTPVNTGVSKP